MINFSSRPGILKWILRCAFVAAMVGGGLWVEHVFYAAQSSLNQTIKPKDPDKIRILFVGGSQMDGVYRSVEKYLNPAGEREKFELFQMILPGFAVTGLPQYHAFMTQKFHPDYIISLVACAASLGDLNGLEVSTGGSSLLPPKEDVYGKIGFFSLPFDELEKVPKSYSYDLARSALIEIIEQRDRQNIATYSFLTPNEKIPADKLESFDQLIKELAFKMLKEGLFTERDQRVFEHLLLLGQKTQRTMLKEHVPLPAFETEFYTKYSSEAGRIQDLEAEVFAPANKFIDEGLAYLKQESCERFVQTFASSLVYNRLWLCGIHQAVQGKTELEKTKIINNMFSSANRYYLGFPKPVLAKTSLPESTTQPYFQQALARLKKNFSKDYTGDPNESSAKDYIEQSFVKNVEIFNGLTTESRQKFILLQVPNIHDNIIADTAKKFKIPVIESAGILDESIKKDGRHTYFMDYTCGSGHLTALGIDIFGGHIAMKFKKLLENPHE